MILKMTTKLWNLAQARKRVNEMKTCKWHKPHPEYEDVYYETSCKHSFMFNDGGVEDNGFDYCPYCGEEIESEESE